jgi:hypothetical protein
MKKKIEFGIAAVDAARKNYQIIFDRLMRGFEKVTGKVAEGLDRIKIQQEAKRRAEDSAKVVDMEGRNLDPEKPIMGGRQTNEESYNRLIDPESPLGEKLAKIRGRGKQDFGKDIRETYDEAKGPGKGDEMVEALKSPGARASTDIIEKQLQETFPDIKLFGDETFEEIMEIQKTGKHPRMKADGGRVNLQLGGLPLSEQGQRIYDSMTRAGFDDMAIARALDEQQAYPEATTLGLQPQTVVPPRVKPILPIGQEGDGITTDINRSNPKFDYEFAALGNLANPDNVPLTEEEQKQLNFQRGKDGLFNIAKGIGYAMNPLAFFAKKAYNMYQDNVQRGIDERTERMRLETIAAQEAEEREAATRALAAANQAAGTGGYQSDFAQDSDFMSGRGTAAEMGSFAKGGLATMFVRKR